MSVKPTDPKCSNDLYLRPLAAPRGGIWYSCRAMGHHKIATFMSEMAKSVGLNGKITNHSLRVTAASRLYQSNSDEQLVMETTGHRSTESVHSYKRTSEDQMFGISEVLYGNANSYTQPPVNASLPVNLKRKFDDSEVHLSKENVPCKKAKVETVGKSYEDGSVNVNIGDKPLCLNFTVNIGK